MPFSKLADICPLLFRTHIAKCLRNRRTNAIWNPPMFLYATTPYTPTPGSSPMPSSLLHPVTSRASEDTPTAIDLGSVSPSRTLARGGAHLVYFWYYLVQSIVPGVRKKLEKRSRIALTHSYPRTPLMTLSYLLPFLPLKQSLLSVLADKGLIEYLLLSLHEVLALRFLVMVFESAEYLVWI